MTFSFSRIAVLATGAVACLALTSAAEAKRHHRAHTHAAKAGPLPAHLKPGYVGAPGFAGGRPGPVVPGFVDLGRGPVFPFQGWPNKL